MVVAVTGANGFIGRHLCRRLAERGDVVRPILRADFAAGRLDELIDGVDVLIHAAGATRAPTEAGLIASNVELTRRIAIAARKAAVKRFVFISSQAAAGPARALDEPVTEETVPAPIEAYGRSKLAAEQIVRDLLGTEQVIVRPAAVYGPGDADFRALFRLASRGIAVHPGNRDHWISIIHVTDCVDGILASMTSDMAAGQTYFLCNARPVQWAELFELAATAAGKHLGVDVEIPAAVVALAARAGDIAARLSGRAGLLTSEKVRLSRPTYWVCSSGRAARDIGFNPSIPLAEGIAATYRSYTSNAWR